MRLTSGSRLDGKITATIEIEKGEEGYELIESAFYLAMAEHIVGRKEQQ